MMRRKLWISSGVTVVVVIAGLLVYGSYISAQYQMEALQTAAHEQWLQLDGAIQRWAAVAPQVGALVGPAAKQNPKTIGILKSASESVRQAKEPQSAIEVTRGLNTALSGVMAIGLSDPQVKSDAKFEALRERIRTMQKRIEHDRERYNESLRNYDLFLGEFPNYVWAKVAGFTPDHGFFPELKWGS